MTTYSSHEIDKTIKKELQGIRKHCPDLKVRLDDPPWYLHINGQNTCLSIRYIAENPVTLMTTQGSFNVAI